MRHSINRSQFTAPNRRRRSGSRANRNYSFVTYPYKERTAVLSRGELAFFRVLRAAVEPRHWISLKMRLADVVQCPSDLWEKAPGRRLSQKHVDFVLYDSETTRIVAAIELDDASHDQLHRRARDRFLDATLRAANTPLIRVRAAYRYDASALRKVITSALTRNDRLKRGHVDHAQVRLRPRGRLRRMGSTRRCQVPVDAKPKS